MTGYPPNPPYGPPGYPPNPPYGPPGYPPPYPPQQPYPQQPPYYPPPPPPPYYPPPPPQQYPPQPPPYYPPAPPPQQYPPQPPPQQQGGAPIVVPLVGTGGARLAASRGVVLTVTPQSFGVSSNRSSGWELYWSEVSWVVVKTAYHQSARTFGVSPKTWRVRLIMNIRDETPFQRIPDMNKGRGKHGAEGHMQVGVALGPVQNVVPQISHALGTYGGQTFIGVIDEGRVIGFGYL